MFNRFKSLVSLRKEWRDLAKLGLPFSICWPLATYDDDTATIDFCMSIEKLIESDTVV